MKKFFLSGLATAMLTLSTGVMAANFVEGRDYTVVENPGQVEVPGKIEVREFFWYGCGHCHALEPHMQTWLKNMPKDVNFVRTPAAMNPTWEVAARGYYVTEALGVRRFTHLSLFDAANKNIQTIASPDSLAKFYVKFGIPEEKFKSMYSSFPISSKIAQSNQLARQYKLTGVPAVVVNGKYVVQGEDAKVPQVINYLIEKEKKAAK